MSFDLARARPLLQDCNLKKLFVDELGWEPCHQRLAIHAGQQDFMLAAVAEKRGFIVWLCESQGGGLPDHTTRLKLDRTLTQTNFEHLIVFATRDHSEQSWTWVRREPGQPLRPRTHNFLRSQPGDSLLQKLHHLYISIEEEEAGISVTQVAGRARAGFDVERVTREFYDQFKREHTAFLGFIQGIPVSEDAEWYASVMLNRMMFVYFIQRKGFLDGDPHYLRNRLTRCQQEKGKNKFYSFYRYFLLRLFHEGFGKRRRDRSAELERLVGNIPYLNGGMFDVHELEEYSRYGNDITIADEAFKRIFDYFDQYDWVLDAARTVRGPGDREEINPDVLGYIFEKYINQKQMGAYYTKEDITEYISKNAILPFLFDSARRNCTIAFENPGGPTVWDLLRDNPDRYLYPAVRHGLSWDVHAQGGKGAPLHSPRLLPPDVAAGAKDVARRTNWNKTAPGEYALPTETWREVVGRRTRCDEIRRKLAAGEVRNVNDFITLNLDIRQFAQDVIEHSEGPELLRAFWHAIENVTVLDPMCGSGGFLVAALNILEPLYEGCLHRMEAFVEDLTFSGTKHTQGAFADFRKVLARVASHPSARYFIFKSIILNNLFGVDIMEEAVEICKLRLFLKLAAQVDPDTTKDNLGIEPLPDVDFNIHAGNSLVGYTTYDEVKAVVEKQLDFDNAIEPIAARAADLQKAFDGFRRLQVDSDASVSTKCKIDVKKRLHLLEDELNQYLAGDYGVNADDKGTYARWENSHKPFHWFVEFYGIVDRGGFDVIIGNPPYVEYKEVRGQYRVKDYATEECGNLFAFAWERAILLVNQIGRVGLIIPVASVCTDGYAALRRVWLSSGSLIVSNFNDRPGKLFDGLEHIRLAIVLFAKTPTASRSIHTSSYNRWLTEARENLFQGLCFTETTHLIRDGSIPKTGSMIEASLLAKIGSSRKTLRHFVSSTGRNRIFYTRKLSSFVQILDFIPGITDGRGRKREPSELKEVVVGNSQQRNAFLCALNSTLFYWLLTVWSDCRNLNKREVLGVPFDFEALDGDSRSKLDELSRALMKDFRKNSKVLAMNYSKWGIMNIQCIYPKVSKRILDEIDGVLASHYGFTAEELDFILNYDVKYRLGRTTEDEADEAREPPQGTPVVPLVA